MEAAIEVSPPQDSAVERDADLELVTLDDDRAATTAAKRRPLLAEPSHHCASAMLIWQFAETGSHATANWPARMEMTTRQQGGATVPTALLAAPARHRVARHRDRELPFRGSQATTCPDL